MEAVCIEFDTPEGKHWEVGPLPKVVEGSDNSFNIGKQLKHIYESGNLNIEVKNCHIKRFK